MANKRELIKLSLANSEAKHLKRPSFKVLAGYEKAPVHLQKAISLRDSSERAYFHFYNDVISKIPFLLRHNIDVLNWPVIVSATTFYKPFFQELLKRSPYMSAIKWHIQGNEMVYCEEALFAVRER